MKKFFALLLTLAMVCSLATLGLTASAQEALDPENVVPRQHRYPRCFR